MGIHRSRDGILRRIASMPYSGVAAIANRGWEGGVPPRVSGGTGKCNLRPSGPLRALSLPGAAVVWTGSPLHHHLTAYCTFTRS